MTKEQAEEPISPPYSRSPDFIFQVSIKGCESIKYKSYLSVLLSIKKILKDSTGYIVKNAEKIFVLLLV